MYQTSIASRQDWPEILRFLERRLLENAWMIWFVHDALGRSLTWERVVVCRSRGQIVAACYMSQLPIRGAEPKFSQFSNHYDMDMDALAPDAVGALLETFPGGSVVHAQLFTPETKEYFDSLPGAERREDDLYFTISADDFRPVESEEVRELTRADDGLFDGCEQRPDWEHLSEHTKVFAILRDTRVASWARLGFMTPVGVVVPRVGAPIGLYTETPYRRQGLARRVVSHITERILRESHRPIYWTEPENIPSQRLCQSLGFRQYAQKINYVWQRAGD